MKVYSPGSNLYIKTYPRKSFTNKISPNSVGKNAMDTALNNGKTNLAFHKIRAFGKSQLWGRLTDKMRRIFIDSGVDHLTREMVGSSVLQKYIQNRNKELMNVSMELCVNNKNAYRPG